ncbi:serine hydrolase domain-containing protein [Nocardia sp. NPDC004168]|uniref:serine hydrolase domain-containing protein n=1 Tax=Nocardia sp. NPDC004168 TaxID=3154452 RepID=UPI0033BCDA3F
MGVRVRGRVEPGYETVAEAFAEYLAETRGGAAFSATVDGVAVVDLWGGSRDDGDRPWEADTLQILFSGSKVLIAVCLLLLLERGELRLDAPIAAYWPEFAAAGKGDVTVAELVSHRARLPGVRTPFPSDPAPDGALAAKLLAEQPREDDPALELAYHGITFGWLCGELIRRVDGRTVGALFHEEFAVPLGLDIWLGLPAYLEPRVGQVRYGPGWRGRAPAPAGSARLNLADSVWANPLIFPEHDIPWNRPAWHRVEIPSSNAIGTARSMARLFGALLGGETPLSPATLALGTTPLSGGFDAVFKRPMRYGVGLQLQTELGHLGPHPAAFGHDGSGGGVHAAWPSHAASISFVPNELHRSRGLYAPVGRILTALHRVLGS